MLPAAPGSSTAVGTCTEQPLVREEPTSTPQKPTASTAKTPAELVARKHAKAGRSHLRGKVAGNGQLSGNRANGMPTMKAESCIVKVWGLGKFGHAFGMKLDACRVATPR